MFDLHCFADFKPPSLCLWYKKVISMQYSGIYTFQHIPQVKGKYHPCVINMVNDLLLVGNVVNTNTLEIKKKIPPIFFKFFLKQSDPKIILGYKMFSLFFSKFKSKGKDGFFLGFSLFFFLHWTYPIQSAFSLCVLSILLLLKYHFYFSSSLAI